MKKRNLLILFLLMLMVFSACNNNKKEDLEIDMPELLETMEEASKWEGMMIIGKKHLTNLYAIDEDEVTAFIGVMKTDGISADEIIIIEAKDAKSAEDLEKKLRTRLDAKATEAKDYLPEEYKVIEEAEILRKDKFLTLIVATNAEELADIFKEAVKFE